MFVFVVVVILYLFSILIIFGFFCQLFSLTFIDRCVYSFLGTPFNLPSHDSAVVPCMNHIWIYINLTGF